MDQIKTFTTFFDSDVKIKNILYELSPKETDKDSTSAFEYGEKLYKALEDIEYYLEKMFAPLNSTKLAYLKEIMKVYHQKLLSCGYKYENLQKFYQVCLSNIDNDFVNKIGNNCVGYTAHSLPLNAATTVNELVHLLHAQLINNEYYYKKLPTLSSKKNGDDYDVTLRGVNNDDAKTIFNAIPADISAGDLDIVALDENRIFIMVRDLGHALTIEIMKQKEKYEVSYFIPKICNIIMVNKLKGVRKVDYDSQYTRGAFDTIKAELASEIVKIIDGVPMDDDMFIEGGIYYDTSKKNR